MNNFICSMFLADAVNQSLQIMWKGMLAVIIAIVAIIVCIYIMQFTIQKLEKFKAEKQENKLQNDNTDNKLN